MNNANICYFSSPSTFPSKPAFGFFGNHRRIYNEQSDCITTTTWLDNLNQFHVNRAMLLSNLDGQTSNPYSRSSEGHSKDCMFRRRSRFGSQNVQQKSSTNRFASFPQINHSNETIKFFPSGRSEETYLSNMIDHLSNVNLTSPNQNKPIKNLNRNGNYIDRVKRDELPCKTKRSENAENGAKFFERNFEDLQSFSAESAVTSLHEESEILSFEKTVHKEMNGDIRSDFCRKLRIENEDILDDEKTIPAVQRSYSDSTVHNRIRRNSGKELKRRKSVHFADTRGFELEVHFPIRQSDDYDVPPRLMEALEKLRACTNVETRQQLARANAACDSYRRHYTLVLNFQQPFMDQTFQKRIAQQNVCLESVSIIPNSLSFTGVIRVANLEFEKKVTVRYSSDHWKSYVDIPAQFVASLGDSQQDQFSFHVVMPERSIRNSKIEIAVHYSLPRSKRDFWDNNYHRNYIISCLEHCGMQCDDGMMA